MSPPPKWPESLEEAKALSRAEWKELIRPQITISNCFAAFLLLVIIVSGAIFFMVLVKWIQPSGTFWNGKFNFGIHSRNDITVKDYLSCLPAVSWTILSILGVLILF